ncbi:DUF302 domain-containing protein [Scandinavium sp. NPDC088450]|uniref:DUF302 domain-containing protein n=1 Tax=Scandinavium sp. NPDC088450 TaxID=3364514 RepID=UPI00384C43EB
MKNINQRWVRKSPYSVRETADRLLAKLSEFPEVMIIADVNQQDVAALSNMKIDDAVCLLFQNTKLVGNLLSSNIEVGFTLPIKAFIWKDKKGQVWIRCNDIDAMDEDYDLNGGQGAIEAIYNLLPGWLDYTVSE